MTRQEQEQLMNCGFTPELLNQMREGRGFGMDVYISPDDMHAYIRIDEDGRSLSEEELEKLLEHNRIKEGIRNDTIETLKKGGYENGLMVLAEGKPVENGKDGWYEFFFRTDVDMKPIVHEDGSVDYANIEWFELVKENQKVAYYHDAKQGVDGFNVNGKALPAKKGMELPPLKGSGFKIEPDKKTYLAQYSGKIELDGDRLEITNILVLDEVTIATGNVNFDGSVYVKGNIGSDVVVKATNDLLVDGYVEAADLECGGSVILKKGMNAAGEGSLKAGKSITAKFFEAVRIATKEDLNAGYCLNCEIRTEGKVIVSDRRGSIAGGSVYAVRGFEVTNVGNRAGLATKLKFGIDETMLKEQTVLEDAIKKLKKEMTALAGARREMRNRYPNGAYKQLDKYMKVEKAISVREGQLKQLAERVAKKREELNEIRAAKAVISRSVFDGVNFEINGHRCTPGVLKDVTLKMIGARIAIDANL